MYTYLISNNINNLTKIGKAADVNKRMREIIGQNPFLKLNLLFCIDGDYEKEIHRMYSELRREGEWFELEEKHLKNIKRVYGEAKSLNKKELIDKLKNTKESKCNPYTCYYTGKQKDVVHFPEGISNLLLDFMRSIDISNKNYSFIDPKEYRNKLFYYQCINDLIDRKLISKQGGNIYYININAFNKILDLETTKEIKDVPLPKFDKDIFTTYQQLIEVNAVQFTEENEEDILDLLKSKGIKYGYKENDSVLYILNNGKYVGILYGDFIVNGSTYVNLYTKENFLKQYKPK